MEHNLQYFRDRAHHIGMYNLDVNGNHLMSDQQFYNGRIWYNKLVNDVVVQSVTLQTAASSIEQTWSTYIYT